MNGVSATRDPRPSAAPVYAAAELWRERCLLDDRSLFTDGTLLDEAPGSLLADAQALIREFVESLEGGEGGFMARLSRQLANSATATVQLAAELLYFHLLIA